MTAEDRLRLRRGSPGAADGNRQRSAKRTGCTCGPVTAGAAQAEPPPKAAVEQRDGTTAAPPRRRQPTRAGARKRKRRRAADAAKRQEEARVRKAEQRRWPNRYDREGVATRPALDPASPLSKRSIYYDFDMYNIGEQFQSMVEAHGKFLLENQELRVRIEGNCDERGSREYNLALGQRRADSVKRALTLLGVPANRIETVSFGAEKPRSLGSNEEAWAENRRSDIVYIGIDSPQ
jgi:peptidoglycan-associated lipoprotein